MAPCALLLLLSTVAIAVPPLPLSEAPTLQSTAGHLETLFDETLTVGLDDVMRGNLLQPYAGSSYWRPLREGATWMRLRLYNPAQSGRPLLRAVRLHTALLDEVDAWMEDGSGGLIHDRAGEDIDVERRLTPSFKPTFELEVPPTQTRAIYLRLRTSGGASFAIDVAPMAVHERQESIRQLVTGILWGLFFLVTLYCGYFFLRFREALYGWLALSTLCMQVVVAFYFWMEASYWFPARLRVSLSDPILHTATVITAGSMLAFLRELLSLHTVLPRVDRVMRVLLLLCASGALAFPFLNSVMRTQMINLLVIIFIIPVSAAGYLALHKDRVAAIACLSVGVLIAGTAMTLLRNFGLVADGPLPEYAPTFAFALHIIVLAMAAGDRIDSNRKERELALQARLSEAERNARLTRTFARFVPMEFLERLERKDITEFELGQGFEKVMTTLFSDIRGFTSIVEKMTPPENFAFINEYLGYMEPAIHDHGGFIDKYMGDAVMALFDDGNRDSNSDENAKTGALRGVRAAVAMQRGADAWNEKRRARGESEVAIGLGLHTGPVMLGTIGGRDRLNASAIGDAVNLASRVEGMTRVYSARILITESTVFALPEGHGFTLRVADRVRVKGKSAPITVFEVLDGESAALRTLKLHTLSVYQAAWDKYQAGCFREAITLLSACKSDEDPAISRLIERCEIMLRQGLPEGWDGVIRLNEK